MNASTKTLVDQLLSDKSPDQPVLERMDDLLRWLGDTEGFSTREISEALKFNSVAANDFRDILLARLDQLLFREGNNPFETLGLPIDASPEVQKARYHRLLKVFHPDRAPDNEQWMTRRAELINSAFDKIRKAEYAKPIPVTAATSASTDSVFTEDSQQVYNPHTRSPLRGRIGLSGNQFRNRVIVGLVALSAVFIGSLYLDYRYSKPSSEVKNEDDSPANVLALAETGATQSPDSTIVAEDEVPASSLPRGDGQIQAEPTSNSGIAAAELGRKFPEISDEVIPLKLVEPEAGEENIIEEPAKRVEEIEPLAAINTPEQTTAEQSPEDEIPVAVEKTSSDSNVEEASGSEKIDKPVSKEVAAMAEKQEAERAVAKKKVEAKSTSNSSASSTSQAEPQETRTEVAKEARSIPAKARPVTAQKKNSQPKVKVVTTARQPEKKSPNIQRKQVAKPARPTAVTVEVIPVKKAKPESPVNKDDYWFSMWLMKAYVQAVEAADMDFLRRAFSSTVNVDGNDRGRDMLLGRYLRLFTESNRRRLDINVKSVTYVDNDPSRIRIRGIETLYRYTDDGAPHVTSKQTEFKVVKIGRGGEITGIARN